MTRYVNPFWSPLPKVPAYLHCTRVLKGEYIFDPSTLDWYCRIPNHYPTQLPDEPFYLPPTEEHNPSRPLPDLTDTNEETPIPKPKPKPHPSPPPVTFDDDTRRPTPSPPVFDPPTIPPTIPRRRLPPTDSTEIEVLEKRLVSIENDAMSRVYGCMLHSPITDNPVLFRICQTSPDSNDPDIIEHIEKAWEYLVRKAAGTGAAELISGACILAVNLLPLGVLRINPTGRMVMAFGCKTLSNIAVDFLTSSNNAYQSIDGQGHINVEYINCSPPDNSAGEDPTEGFALKDFNINECFVPIRNFKVNEPEQLGMKTQLQIIYELTEEIVDDGEIADDGNETGEFKTWQKAITIPSPLPPEDIEVETIKEVFPETLDWGQVKVETDVVPYGYIRLYTTEANCNGRPSSFIDELLDDIFDNLVEGEELIIDTGNTTRNNRRFSYRTRDHKTGTFKRKKAFYFKYENGSGQPPLCNVFYLD